MSEERTDLLIARVGIGIVTTVVAIVLVAVVVVELTDDDSSPESKPAASEADRAPPPASEPPDEIEFLEAIEDFRDLYDEQSDDVKQSAVKEERNRRLREIVKGGHVSGWIGEIAEVGKTSEDRGYVSVRIGEAVHLNTRRDDASDAGAQTLIESSSPVYAALAKLEPGARIRFSGRLEEEASRSEEAGMIEPEFLMRFTTIEPLR